MVFYFSVDLSIPYIILYNCMDWGDCREFCAEIKRVMKLKNESDGRYNG